MGKEAVINYSDYLVLLVDDDTELLDSNSYSLKERGFKVRCASSGEEAIEIVKNEKVDVMVIDYFMPGLTGEETVVKIRKFNSRLVILMQTGYAGDKPAIDMLQTLEMQGYHDKSNGFHQLLIWVMACVRNCEQQREIESLNRDVILANTTVEDLERQQMSLIEETRLSTLGQLVNSVPATLINYAKQADIELLNVTKDLKYYINNIVGSDGVLIKWKKEVASKIMASMTSAKKSIQNLQRILDYVEESEPTHASAPMYHDSVTYQEIITKFVTLLRYEMRDAHGCELNFVEESLLEISQYSFGNDVVTIFQILQSVALECAKIISKKRQAPVYLNKEFAKCFNYNHVVMNFCVNFIDKGLSGRRSIVQFQIGIPNSGISEEIRKDIVNSSKDGNVGLTLFTAQLILRKKFRGRIACTELGKNEAGGGILFSISVPATKISYESEGKWV